MESLQSLDELEAEVLRLSVNVNYKHSMGEPFLDEQAQLLDNLEKICDQHNSCCIHYEPQVYAARRLRPPHGRSSEQIWAGRGYGQILQDLGDGNEPLNDAECKRLSKMFAKVERIEAKGRNRGFTKVEV